MLQSVCAGVHNSCRHFAGGGLSQLVANRLYSGYTLYRVAEHLFVFVVKLLSYNNYITICGGISGFLF